MTTSPRHHGTITFAAVLLAAAIGLVADGGVPARAAPGDFTVAPTTLSFPATYIGATTEIAVVVTNVSSTSQSPAFAGGAPSDSTNFGSVQNCAGKTFSPGVTCTFTYSFKPTVPGPLSTVTAIGVNGKNFAISMSGNAIDLSATTTTTTTTTSTTATTSTSPATTTPGSPTTAPSAETTSPATTSIAPGLPFSSGPGPIVSGQAAVIAQGIVEFPAGLLQWDHQQLDPGSWPFAFDGAPPVFFVSDGPDAVLVSGADGPLGLLHAGEATFVQSGSSGSVAPTFDGAVAAARRITFVSGAGPDSFTPGEGRRDVNLIQGFVAPGESVSLTSPFPILVVVTDGELVDATGSVVGVSTGAVTLGEVVELRNDGSEPAIVLAAAVGALIP